MTDTPKVTVVVPDQPAVVVQEPVPYQTALGIYFVMDEKYSGDADTSHFDEWLATKLETIDHTGQAGIGLYGGGPNNSEWNPANDLFIVATLADITVPPSLKVFINDKSYRKAQWHFHASPTGKGVLAWFILPESYWSSHLRKVTYAEEKELWPDSAAFYFSPDPAELISIRVESKQVKLKGYFRAAFGE